MLPKCSLEASKVSQESLETSQESLLGWSWAGGGFGPVSGKGAAVATGATEVVSRMVSQTPPPTHAGGQDDSSLANSLKSF